MRQGAVGGEEGSNKAGDVSEKSLQSLTVPNCTTVYTVLCLLSLSTTPSTLCSTVYCTVFLFCPLLNASVDLQVQVQ